MRVVETSRNQKRIDGLLREARATKGLLDHIWMDGCEI
jgi:hypothetical protein